MFVHYYQVNSRYCQSLILLSASIPIIHAGQAEINDKDWKMSHRKPECLALELPPTNHFSLQLLQEVCSFSSFTTKCCHVSGWGQMPPPPSCLCVFSLPPIRCHPGRADQSTAIKKREDWRVVWPGGDAGSLLLRLVVGESGIPGTFTWLLLSRNTFGWSFVFCFFP